MKHAAWKKHTIAEIGKFLGGATPSTAVPAYWNGDIHWTTSKRLGGSVFVTAGERFISKLGLDNSSTNLVPRGNLLIGTRVGVGKVAVNKTAMAISQDLTGVVVDREQFNPVFLAYCLSQSHIQARIIQQARGVTIKGIPREDLKLIEFQAPATPEQKNIAAVLWAVQRAGHLEQELAATTRQLKHTTMSHLLTRGLRDEPQKDTDIGPRPRSWQLRPLSAVATLERGRFLHRPRNEPRFYGGKTPFVQTGDVVRSQGWIREFTQTLNDSGVAISRVFPSGTILITIAANIGFTGVLDFDSACPDSLVGITPSTSLDTWFLEYYLQSQQPDMDRTAPKGTQKNINIQFLSPWPIIVPPIDEQREIASILRTIDQKIAMHDRKRAAFSDMFETLLHELMTPKIRVDKLDIDTSEVAG